MKKTLISRSFIIITFLILTLVTSFFFFNSRDTQAARKTLYYGSQGSDVRILQWKLQQWGYYDGKIDGVFSSKTWEAVKKFQRKNGLRVDGVVGAETWQALGYQAQPRIERYTNAEPRVAFSNNVNRNDNVELMARLIHGEAGGEPYEGQVAVGAVLLNRVDSPAFPNTLSGVIYQPLAFESVSNGQFNTTPTAESIKAARAAINGWDPTYGATFFWNPSKPVNKWIWSRKIVRTIGGHVFAD